MIKDQDRKQMQFEVVKDPSQTGRRLVVNMIAYKGFTSVQEKRHKSAMNLLEMVVNSREFRDRVRAIKAFTSSANTGTEVYNKIMTGEEKLQPGKDAEIDLQVTLYESNNSTVGYTYDGVIGTWVNNKFFKQYSLGEIAGNAMHEWLHKLGFGHTSNFTAARADSVPYKIGYIMRDMIEAYEKGTQKLTDLYAIIVTNPGTPTTPPVVITVPTPVVVAPVELRKKVCGWTWRFWLGKVCWYE